MMKIYTAQIEHNVKLFHVSKVTYDIESTLEREPWPHNRVHTRRSALLNIAACTAGKAT